MDVFYKLFAENEVVLLKTHPVNAYLEPFFKRAFAPLIDAGVLAIVHGNAALGHDLCHHERVDTVHLTGSVHTHEAIVWGEDADERVRRKAANDPVLDKPITSELGCVTPVLVAPGPWSDADLAFQARNVAAMVANNASFNCNAAKVLVTARDWPQRDAFLAAVRGALGRVPARRAYYPGAQERYQAFCEHYPAATPLIETDTDAVPWTIIPDVPPTAGEYALTHEAFCGVLADVALNGADASTFLDHAVDFANETVWGTLSCMMLVHPSTEREHAEAIDRAIAALRYGSIGVNLWSGVMYALGVTPWGAFPGHPLTDVRSGRGVVHNTMLFDHPQKCVARAPFRIRPKPAWFADHRTLDALGRRLTRLEAAPTWWRLPGIFATALRA
jgi:acyl-CoA reductase-like NAD-dependent aldehyde dehydrogenase